MSRRAYRPTLPEQETTLRWDREDDQVHVWSGSPAMWRKLERLGVPPVRETTSYGQVSGRFYRIPLGQFRWGLKRKGRPSGAGFPRSLQEARVAGGSATSGSPAEGRHGPVSRPSIRHANPETVPAALHPTSGTIAEGPASPVTDGPRS